MNTNANSNKRPASPISIDAEENDRSKKLKTESPEALPEITNDNNELKLPTKEEVFDEDMKKSLDDMKLECLSGIAESSVKDEPVKMEKPDFILKPEPEKKEKRTIVLEFAEKFKKGFAEMSRKNLEELVLEKNSRSNCP